MSSHFSGLMAEEGQLMAGEETEHTGDALSNPGGGRCCPALLRHRSSLDVSSWLS